jgi:enediyne polyketide synthase
MKKPRKHVASLNEKYKKEKNFFKIDFKNNGPQGQLVYIVRFPVSYKNLQLMSKRVSFLSYFDWMGQIREYSLRPINQKIFNLTRKKKWGLATNSTSLKVLGLLDADDVVEVRLWLDKITGFDNIYHLCFDWLRLKGGDKYERVALSKMVVSCVEIIDHGKAVITRPPDFLFKFFESMKPRRGRKDALTKYNALFKKVSLGKKIKDYKANPQFISERHFFTSLSHSNLIGNIYFANYSKWIGTTKDFFFHDNIPEFFRRDKFDCEFITLECKITHLNEAMPFDKVFVKMYLSELYEKGIVLKYEVFKEANNSNHIKLSNASQTIVFTDYSTPRPEIKKMPMNILNILN